MKRKNNSKGIDTKTVKEKNETKQPVENKKMKLNFRKNNLQTKDFQSTKLFCFVSYENRPRKKDFNIYQLTILDV